MSEQVDVVVIGMGVGGEEVAGRLSEAGLLVVGVEAGLVGGECPYWGCIPTKMMVRAAGVVAEVGRAEFIAGLARIEPDWGLVAHRIRSEATDSWDDKVAVDRFVGKGGRFVRGRAVISAVGEVTVGDEVFSPRRGIVVATGTLPAVPDVPGLGGTPYWTNRDAVKVERPPASLLVMGGGAVGLELGQVFARFGTKVTVVEAADRLLPGEEPEAGHLVAEVFTGEGVDVRVGTAVEGVRHDGSGFVVDLVDAARVEAERLLVATGRGTDLAGLGVDLYGVDAGARAVPTDEWLRAAEGLWAVGDVTGHGAFTHVAMYQAGVVVRDILGEAGPPASYHAVPRVTFTDSEVGGVGVTEEAAHAARVPVRVGVAQVPSSARGWIHQAGNDGFVKLVEDADRGVLVGATAVGPHGGEVLGALAVAVRAGVPTATLRNMIYAYPTFHRAIEDALRDLGSHDRRAEA